MGFFDWLLGTNKSRVGKLPTGREGWTTSENGNPTLVMGGMRLTVFQQDGGWTYCISELNRPNEPHFSDTYATAQIAKEEALASLRGEPSRHQTRSASSAENRRERWEEQIRERNHTVNELKRLLSENSDLGITALRKPETKIASQLKQLGWQLAEYQRAGVSDDLLLVAEEQKMTLAKLSEEVAARIEKKQVIRSPRRKPVTDSQLSPSQACKVDALIRTFLDNPIMAVAERERRSREATRVALAKMVDDGASYGQASGTPDFLNQDEQAFRTFIKQVDQDIEWQCSTVMDAFTRYLKVGEVPAPHYPMRVAVLLRKAKDHDREKQFLAAWCRHFPVGNGATYVKLVERAKAVGAI